MVKKLTLAFYLLSFASLSQNQNKKIYYFFDDNPISKTAFDLLNKNKTYWLETKNDSSIIKKSYLHEKIFQLDSTEIKKMRIVLNKIIGSNFNPKLKTMIHVFKEKDKSFSKSLNNKKYFEYVNNHFDKYQYYFIGTKDSQIVPDDKNHTYIDYDNLLEKLFFQNSPFKINHLLFKPDGLVYLYFGLEDTLLVLDMAVD